MLHISINVDKASTMPTETPPSKECVVETDFFPSILFSITSIATALVKVPPTSIPILIFFILLLTRFHKNQKNVCFMHYK